MRRIIAVVLAMAFSGVWDEMSASGAEKMSLRGKQIIARFDVNKDGKIDSQERVASKQALHQRFLAAEAARKRAEMLSRASMQQFGAYGGYSQFGGFQQLSGVQAIGGIPPMGVFPPMGISGSGGHHCGLKGNGHCKHCK